MSDLSAMSSPAANPSPRSGPFLLVIGIVFLVTAGLMIIAAIRADPFVSRWVLTSATPPVKRAAQFLSKSGEGQWPIGLGLVIMIVGWTLGRCDWRRAGLAIVVATVVAGGAAITVRAATGRARPSNTIEQGWFGPYHNGQWSAFRHAYSSFPSGHAATAAGFAVALACVARRWGWASLFWMTGVGWSRICLEAHSFSDVIAGLLFGLATALLVLRSFGWPRLENPKCCPGAVKSFGSHNLL